MSKNYYMHLMDGAPAYFDKDTRELYFIPQYHKLSAPDILYHSLEQLKKDQKEYRNTGNWTLSYMRILAGWEQLWHLQNKIRSEYQSSEEGKVGGLNGR